METSTLAVDARSREIPLRPQTRETLQASYLTHELRAPLTSINLTLEILREQLQDRIHADEKQLFSIALKNVERLGGLINDIMDYAKVSAGKLSFNLGENDPNDLLNEALNALKPCALAKGIIPACSASGELLPRVKADPKRIVQVLINLLSNAVKFTPAGGEVELGAAAGRRQDAGSVVFWVRDTGCGIPAKDLDRIFSAFEQSAAGDKAAGTGLGLTLAKAMVEGHGGRIWVDSRPGVGTTFYFTIPLV